jgi:hypothetical protein
MAQVKNRDSRGRASRTPEQIAFDLRAAELRSKSMTYTQIAAALGLETATGAYHAVQRGIREIPTEGAEEAKRIELAKLDTVERAAWTVLESLHYVVIESGPNAGTFVYSPATPDMPLVDDSPVLAAIDRIVKVSESRRKMLGLDEPRKSIVNVITEDMVDAEIRRLTDELSRNDPSPTGETTAAS